MDILLRDGNKDMVELKDYLKRNEVDLSFSGDSFLKYFLDKTNCNMLKKFY